MRKTLSLVLVFTMLLSLMPAAMADGTYTGTAAGYGGDVTAEVTFDDAGNITSLTVDAACESTPVGVDETVAAMTERILAAGTADGVDTYSGATITSNAILAAVGNAMVEAGVKEAPSAEIIYVPGTYTGSSNGRNGQITVSVTVSENAIESVDVVEQYETAGISDLPLERIPQEIVQYQSLGVDTVAGATLCSYGILNAVADAVTQAGADAAALRAVPVEYPEAEVEDRNAQIVVVGAGMAGLVAAVTAANEGADVILVEKLPYVGGTLLVSAGGLAISGSTYVAENSDCEDSIEDTMEWVRNYNAGSVREPDYDFVETVQLYGGEAVDYLANELNILPTSINTAVPNKANYGGSRNGAGFVDELSAKLTEQGVTVLLNTTATELVLDGQAVTGVRCTTDGKEFTITADKTILATGGASRDMERMTSVTPGLANTGFENQTSVGSTGDGFDMLEAIGVQMGDGPYIKDSLVMFSSATRTTWATNGTISGTLLFDQDGIRFLNEGMSALGIDSALAEHGSTGNYVLFDSAMLSTRADVSGDGTTFREILDANADNPDVVVKGANIQEIAQKLGINEQVLTATYNRYQALCAKGVDTDLGKPAANLIAYDETDGLYAVRVYPGCFGSIGGALTNDVFHPLYEDGTAVENLFTVGELATSTLFGRVYMGGFSLGYYTGAGYKAAMTAVEEINAK